MNTAIYWRTICNRISCNSSGLLEGCEKDCGTSWMWSLKIGSKYFMMIWQMKIVGKYLENICTMNGAWDKKVILRFLLEHEKIWLHTKFQIYPTPRSGFLPTNPTFSWNFWKKYFSVDLFTVLHPSKLVLIILDLNWAKTRALLLQVFEISN